MSSSDLSSFWESLADHMPTMVADGWSEPDAAGTLVGSVLVPIGMGYDANGSLAKLVRGGVSMERREKAATLAAELAELLDQIKGEPLPPDAVVSVQALLPRRLIARDAPSYFLCEPTAELLRRLAGALSVPPDYSTSPGLASQKTTWRGFIREVQDNLRDHDFTLREIHAVALVQTICAHAGVAAPPSRDAVRDALRMGGLSA
ncbi:hypothetical protein [Aphanothece microscopica]|uniref:hypothetical protein n=1 Tax=Aphanothece microscopica TaxID=1049561 RepID=UPI0039850FAF